MAIAFDNSTDGGLVNPGTSLTYAHICTGSDLILFVSAFGATPAEGGDVITGVTYAGAAMTLVGKLVTTSDRWTYLFVKFGPATGSNNVVVSASSSIPIGSHASSYSGADQGGTLDASNTFTSIAPAFDLTASLTVVTANSWMVGGFRTGNTTATVGAGTTQREGSNGLYTADKNAALAAGSQSLIYTAGSGIWSAVAAVFKPATIAAGNPWYAYAQQ